MALHRLDAAEREHKATTGIAPVGAQAEIHGHACARMDHSCRSQLDLGLEAGADKRVAHEDQTLAQRHSDTVREFDWRRSGSPLGTVDHDIVERDPRLAHGFHDREDFVRLADTQLDADRLTAGKLA